MMRMSTASVWHGLSIVADSLSALRYAEVTIRMIRLLILDHGVSDSAMMTIGLIAQRWCVFR